MLRMLNRYRDELGVDGAARGARRSRRGRPSQQSADGDRRRVAVERAERRGRTARRRRRRPEPDRPQAADRLSVAPRLAARHGPRRGGRGRSSNRARSRRPGRSTATTTTPIRRRFEPHYAEIREPGQVQIYESIMGDPAGAPTTGLLTARALPQGQPPAAARVRQGDRPSATSRSSAARRRTPTLRAAPTACATPSMLAGTEGPLQVDVELRFQAIGFRWAQNLKTYDAAEPGGSSATTTRCPAVSSEVLARACAVATAQSTVVASC